MRDMVWDRAVEESWNCENLLAEARQDIVYPRSDDTPHPAPPERDFTPSPPDSPRTAADETDASLCLSVDEN